MGLGFDRKEGGGKGTGKERGREEGEREGGSGTWQAGPDDNLL